MPTNSYNRLRGIVRSVVQTGELAHVVLESPEGEQFTAVLTKGAATRLALDAGDTLEATVHVAEVAANGRRAQSVVRTHTPARGVGDGAQTGSTAV